MVLSTQSSHSRAPSIGSARYHGLDQSLDVDLNGIKARNRAVGVTQDQRQLGASECYVVDTFALLQILNDGDELLTGVLFDNAVFKLRFNFRLDARDLRLAGYDDFYAPESVSFCMARSAV
ncbi:hypothetical protein MA05_05530 [Comamonas aquatica]|nr:hypothetical protein MA05_05530 [Comamonas aquatica]